MTVRRNLLLLALVFSMVVAEGCTIAKISGRGSVPLIMNQPQAKVKLIKQVKTSKMIVFDYTSAFDVSEVLGDIMAGTNADAIINLVIVLKTTPMDFLINLITLGIANAKTFEISGQAVIAPEGLGSILIPSGETVAESAHLDDLVPLAMQQSHHEGSSSMIIRVKEGEAEESYRLVRYNSDTSLQ